MWWCNCSYKGCKAPVKSSPTTNQHAGFLQAGYPSCRPNNSVRALNGSLYHSTGWQYTAVSVADLDMDLISAQHQHLGFVCFVCLVFNGTFGINRLYRTTEVWGTSSRARDILQTYHAIKQWKNAIKQHKHSSAWALWRRSLCLI